MIRLYKDLYIGSIMSDVAGFALAVILILNHINLMVVYVVMIVWIFVTGFLFNRMALNRMNKLNDIMNQKCHAQEFVQQLLGLQGNVKGKVMELFFATNLAAGYLNLGDADTALFHLQNVAWDEKTQMRKMYAMRMAYYNNSAMAYIMKKNQNGADQMLSNMKNILDTAKLKPKARQVFEKLYRIKCMHMRALQGNYEGTEEFCVNALEHADSLLEQVVLCDFLRDACLHEGKWQEAEKCREFILENGGDTYFVAKAQRS